MMAHIFSPNTWEIEAGRSPSVRPAWSPGLHTETPPGKTKRKKGEGRKREKRKMKIRLYFK